MRKTKTYFEKEAKDGMIKGMETVYKGVGNTLGSKGKNAIYRRWGVPHITTDGLSIARQINPENDIERMGADLIKDVLEKVNESVGDGTSTSTVVTYNLIQGCLKYLEEHPDKTPAHLMQEFDAVLAEAHKVLGEKAVKVSSDEDLLKIATISYENSEVARIVVNAVKDAGDTGRVIPEESNGLTIEQENIPGMEIEGGFTSPYFITHPEKQEVIVENPYILVTDKTFVLNNQILPFLDECATNKIRNIVMVCKDMQAEAFASVIANKVKFFQSNGQTSINVVAVKAPIDPDFLEDLSNFCGKQSPLLDASANRPPKMSDLVKIRKVIASKNKTLFVKDSRDDHELAVFSSKVNTLQEMKKINHGHEKSKIEDRLARLTGKVVIIKVGSIINADVPRIRLKIEDAVFAVKAAQKEGYVPGGGITLRHSARVVHERLSSSASKILVQACDKPVEILIKCSGGTLDESKINDKDGFDTKSVSYVKNIADMGIIDPVLVPKEILRYAIELTKSFINLDTLIIDIPEPQPQQ